MDWSNWVPEKKATLCFIFEGENVLLIRKKRGLGEGKINGPGGKLELNESFEEAAIRETFEEVGLKVSELKQAGELHFKMSDSADMSCLVYTTRNWTGTPIETDEAAPFWCHINEIPYDEMWEDDKEWFPLLLSQEYFKGYYAFEGDQVISATLETASNAS